MKTRFWTGLTLPARVMAPEGEGAAGAADAGAAAAAAAAAAGDPGAGGDAGGDAGAGAKWWEGKGLSDTQRQSLTSLGLTVDDPVEAVARLTDMELAAKRKLGAPAGSLIAKPGEGVKVAEWMRQNAEVFGIPESPDKYTVEKPEGWPKDAPWDTEFETQARAIAHEEGLSGAALQRLTDLYATKVGSLIEAAERDASAANAELQAELQKDWGKQYAAKVNQARQAAAMLAEAAGLDTAAIEAIGGLFKPTIGDANTMRLFAKVGELMGEDSAAALTGGGAGAVMTPAGARQAVAAMLAEGSDYRKAMKAKMEGKPAGEYERLHRERLRLEKIAAGE